MPKTLSMDRKNLYRREESQRVRIERIISGYVKYRHPKIYNEAYGFYEHLDRTYPEKKDLRRSNEYEWLKSGSFGTMRKYYRRGTTNPRKTKVTDNMVLEIPLMDETEITVETTVESSSQSETTVESSNQSETTVESSSQPETTVQSSSLSETTVESSSLSETTVESSSLSIPSMTAELPPISDEMLEQIIGDLGEDPDIDNFFSDIDFELDDCPLW